MGSFGKQDEAPDAAYPRAPDMMYPAPLEAERGAVPSTTTANGSHDIETPILIVGGGPVGMLQALMLARIHKKRCFLIEREDTTTTYPKMEYTNGRSMEIYRAMGLADEFRAVGTSYVPEEASNDEIIVTSLFGDAKKQLIDVWKRPGAAEMRQMSRETNDGTQYLEPHLRCHQIPVEKWLKEMVERESDLIESHWGWQFLGLVQEEDGVVSEVRRRDGKTFKIRSQYVIGCDGGGSWVRKSAGLESPRTHLNLTVAFVHFKSTSLRNRIRFQRFWHANIIGGGIIVSQNEDDLWTCHLMLPPEVDGSGLSAEDIVATSLGGCTGPQPVEFDEVYARGIWKVDVAIANNFRSGRVFLAGDAAHQLSPIGGHGLNSGLADAFDLAWKLTATMDGWGGENLLNTYDFERRQIADKNLDTVKYALGTILMPIFIAPVQQVGGEVLSSDTPEGERARNDIRAVTPSGEWFHLQNGNMLGYQYKDSPTLVTKHETTERPISDKSEYIPTTWPGSRTPHVWMKDPKRSTLDHLKVDSFNLVNFSSENASTQAFETAAKELNVPLQLLGWQNESHVRKIYERDLILVRPDMHTTWRAAEGATEAVSVEEARQILATAVGRA